MDNLISTLTDLKIQKQHIENELSMIKNKIAITTKQLQDTCLHATTSKSHYYDGHKHYHYYVCDVCSLEINKKG